MEQKKHISVCVNTYLRPALLEKLLDTLADQNTEGLFTFSVVVVDNDAGASAGSVVKSKTGDLPFQVTYDVEPQQNIALARNLAVDNAKGDLIAFIDDDEFPDDRWLFSLLEEMDRSGADGVFGPVRPHFDEPPPNWLVKGRLCERPEHLTGTVLDSPSCRTGNALVASSLFTDEGAHFDPAFGRSGGEDGQFFLQQIQLGRTFVWCNEAVVYEVVPRERWTRSYYLKRQMRIGGVTGELIRKKLMIEDPAGSLQSLGVSFGYTLLCIPLLPLSLVLGQDKFMKVLLKAVYSASILTGFFGLVPFRNREE